MGQILANICKIVEEKAGTNGRIRLVSLTGVSIKDAKEHEDKPELIELFKSAADQVLGLDIEDLMKS